MIETVITYKSDGGMAIEVVTLFLAPVLYCWVKERRLQR